MADSGALTNTLKMQAAGKKEIEELLPNQNPGAGQGVPDNIPDKSTTTTTLRDPTTTTPKISTENALHWDQGIPLVSNVSVISDILIAYVLTVGVPMTIE